MMIPEPAAGLRFTWLTEIRYRGIVRNESEGVIDGAQPFLRLEEG